MKNKIKLFLDFDDTLSLTTKQFVKVANKKFNVNQDWTKTKTWNFTDIYPTITDQDIQDIFCSSELFVDLEPQKDMAKSLNNLSEYIDINIVTIGYKSNLDNKSKWLKQVLPNINTNFLGILDSKGKIIYDKSCINMKNGIFIDDRVDNLRSSNASIKILYKNYHNYYWQKTEPNDEFYIVNTWSEIQDILNFFINNSDFITK